MCIRDSAQPAQPEQPVQPAKPNTTNTTNTTKNATVNPLRELLKATQCQYQAGFGYKYNLTGVMTNTSDDLSIEAFQFGTGAKIYFRFCTGPLKVDACKDKNADIAIVSNGKCHPLNLIDSDPSKTTFFDEKQPTDGFNITFPYNDKELTQRPEGKIVFSFKCAGNDSAQELQNIQGSDDNGTVYITALTRNGCTNKNEALRAIEDFFERAIAKIVKTLKNGKWILAGLLIMLGLCYTFFGYKFLKFMFAAGGFLIGFGFWILVFALFTGVAWWAYVISILIGALCGFIAVKLITCAYIALGGLCGALVGTSIKSAVMKIISFFLVRWFFNLVIVALVIVGAYYAWRLKRPSLVIITSIIGGQLIAWGWWLCFFWTIWLIILIALTFSGVGVWVQWKTKRQVDESEQVLMGSHYTLDSKSGMKIQRSDRSHTNATKNKRGIVCQSTLPTYILFYTFIP
eukprot:TRINITY_DN1865_c0_g1_i1.p1 TRINITY_DN1865_c0_g1~~TRINITY_DN1865_c0_g1_i1.p1  ORF type:complete len:498 (-),score=166.14 TRINITY_DN1865_c0_g1_i1:81-1454(-)